MTTSRRAAPTLLTAAALFAGSVAAFWPGIATYDTVAQYDQVRAGAYDDWHPPAMARLWSLIAPLGPGAAPMLVVQLALYWLGLGLLAGALARRGTPRRSAAIVAVGAWPLFLGWQGVVLKDAQLVGAMLAATGLVAWWRLRGARLPVAATAAVAVLLGYALLVRANAVFAVVPFAALLLPLAPAKRAGIVAIGTIVALAIAPVINHRLLDAQTSGVEKTQALYDLAGIAVRSPPGATPIDAARVAAIVRRHCVKPFFWDPLGEPSRCDALIDPLRLLPTGTLYGDLARAAATHPFAYAAQRLAHLNATERWLVADRWPSATPPDDSERAALGRPRGGGMIERWQALAGAIARTPAGWPIVFVGLALALIPLADTRPAGRLAAALIGSALAQEASFAVISIASDLRYHLWPMIAVTVAAILAWRRPLPRATVAALVALALFIAAGLAARAILPVPPQSYAALLR